MKDLMKYALEFFAVMMIVTIYYIITIEFLGLEKNVTSIRNTFVMSALIFIYMQGRRTHVMIAREYERRMKMEMQSAQYPTSPPPAISTTNLTTHVQAADSQKSQGV